MNPNQKLLNHSLLISIDAMFGETIHDIRQQQVLIDEEASKILQLTLTQLQQKVRNNRTRFPNQFMFQLTTTEINILFSGTTNRKKIYAFTWGGLMMLAGLVKTKRATEISLQLIRYYGTGLLDKIATY